jgi:hypothetical protein
MPVHPDHLLFFEVRRLACDDWFAAMLPDDPKAVGKHYGVTEDLSAKRLVY